MTYQVTKSVTDIVSEAYRLLNIVDGEQDPSGLLMTRGARMLQIMLKSFVAQGVQMWLRRNTTIDLIEGMADYEFSAEGIAGATIIHATLLDPDDPSAVERPINLITRRDYLDQLNKQITGTPTMAWFSVTEEEQTVTMWPVPNADWQLKIDYRQLFTEFTTTTDLIEVPDYWMEALIYKLGERFIIPFGRSGTPTAQEIRGMAMDLYDTACAFDVMQDGGGEIRFVPDYQQRR